ncbi:killer cell lectin-like receptor 2 isoform X3 [Grammomys surdaster]|uniref:killer cell lectin-like receptor 2 isoform X3 n=1 Tax=Grammomys surdaster TaxID=491861 RepID=UPI00109F9C47|nr:killer cell lectin-like receptor 2 isoform X3 [Grammomys surdaster]
MSEQEVTYATVRFHKSSGLQNQVRLDETQGPREASHKECSVSWHLIVIPLGILCSILLVTVAVLVTHIFQYSKEKHELQETLNNLNHNYSSMKNESYLNKGMLRNKSIECNSYKNLLDTFKRQQNRCHMEAKVILDCLQHREVPSAPYYSRQLLDRIVI